jgi:hypothetical protein
MTTRTTKITVETHEVIVMQRFGSLMQSYCEQCGEATRLLRVEEAALLGAGIDAICQKAGANGLHLVETSSGQVFLCLNSLLKLQGEGANP